MMDTTTEGPSGQLLSWRQQSLEQFVAQGGQLPASQHKHAQSSLRFCKDPYTLSHPIYATCGRIRMGKPALSVNKAVQQLSHRKVAHIATLPCPPHYRGRESNQGINIITMDPKGRYLAVSSRSGFVRLYDGQALLEASYDREVLERLQPVGIIDTRKSIAKMDWHESPEGRCELLLCFSFASIVQLFDLSSEMGSNLAAKRVLETNGIGKDGGHLSAILWTKERKVVSSSSSYLLSKQRNNNTTNNSNNTGSNGKISFFIAGNEKGVLHCWNLTSPSMNKCFWNVKMDPSRSLELSRPVVGLQLSRPDQLLACSDDGLLTVWDLLKSKPAAFGVNSNEPALLFYHHVDVPSSDRVHQVQVCAANPDTALLLLTQQVWLVNVYTKSVLLWLSLFDPSSVLMRSELIPEIDLTADHWLAGDQLDLNRSRSSTRHLITPQLALPDHFPSMLYASYGNQYFSSVDVEAAKSFNLEWDLCASQSIRRNVQTGEVESCYRKGKAVSFQLPGFIMYAESGDYELQLSHDIQHYVGNNVSAYSSVSRSNDVWIVWRDEDGTQLSIPCTVDSTRPHYIKLCQPYQGPTVEHGFPRVYLKTNLIPGGWAESSSRWTTTHQAFPLKHVVSQLDFGSNCILSTFTHQSQFCSIVGFVDDSIGIVGLRSKALVDDDFPTLNPDASRPVDISATTAAIASTSSSSSETVFEQDLESVIPAPAERIPCEFLETKAGNIIETRETDIYMFDEDSEEEEEGSEHNQPEDEECHEVMPGIHVLTKTSYVPTELKFESKKRPSSLLEDSILNPRRKSLMERESSMEVVKTLPGKENQSVVLKTVANLFAAKTSKPVVQEPTQKPAVKSTSTGKLSKAASSSGGKINKITSFFTQNK